MGVKESKELFWIELLIMVFRILRPQMVVNDTPDRFLYLFDLLQKVEDASLVELNLSFLPLLLISLDLFECGVDHLNSFLILSILYFLIVFV